MNFKKINFAYMLGAFAIILSIITLIAYTTVNEKWMLILIGIISLTLYIIFLKILEVEYRKEVDNVIEDFIDYISKNIPDVRFNKVR